VESKCHLFFDTIATQLRIDILAKLKENSFSVSELSKELGQERSKVSHSLKALSDCSFVKAKKCGRQRIYSLNKETMLPLLTLVDKHVEKYCKTCKKQKREIKNE
jgi:DNA-binding transcriptional ArsR family regulator